MSKVTAPLLSFGASGSIAKTQVYSKWKGRAYVRRHVIPANPNSAEQQLTRNSFTWLSQLWKNSPALVTAPWDLFAQGQVLTGRNAWIGKNIEVLRTLSVNDDMIFSPGAKGGPAPTSVTAAAGVTLINVTIVPPTPPTGWTITQCVAAAIRQQDPQSGLLYTVAAAFDATDPFVPSITGLVTGQVYVVGGWVEYAKPDGSVAYSPSLNDTATPT